MDQINCWSFFIIILYFQCKAKYPLLLNVLLKEKLLYILTDSIRQLQLRKYTSAISWIACLGGWLQPAWFGGFHSLHAQQEDLSTAKRQK